MLRESLSKKETEISRQKQEKMQQIELNIRQQSEKEKSLEHDVDRLKVQLQFKEQEMNEMKKSFIKVECQLKKVHRINECSPQKPSTSVSPRKGGKSPKIIKVR